MTLLEHFRKLSRRATWSGACLVWGGAKTSEGYGALTHRGRFYYAHRLVLSAKLGRTLRRKELALHRCDNPSCINAHHLYAGSYSDNLRDAWKRGRRT